MQRTINPCPCAQTTMRMNVFVSGFYQFMFLAFLINVWVVQSVNFTFVIDSAQRKLCRVHSKSACLSDTKCGWIDFMRLCNEVGYQPDVQTCGEFLACRGCDIPTKRPDTDGWKLVFELEDDNLVDDIPDDHPELFKGFKTKNAFFVGAQKLKSIEYNKVQLCAGYRASALLDGCARVKCYDLKDNYIQNDESKYPENINNVGFSKSMSKAITCFAGGGAPRCGTFMKPGFTNSWRFPIGYADDPAPMDTYGNAETGGLKYHCNSAQGQVYSVDKNGWTMAGYGWTAIYNKSGGYHNREKTHNEIGMHPGKPNQCGNKAKMPTAVATDTMEYMNLFQIRVKNAPPNEGLGIIGNCQIPTNSPYEDGWKVVFELEDDNNVDDVPDDPDVVSAGFKTTNAFFVGNQKLKSMTYTKTQLCAGYRASTDGCPRVKCYDLEDSHLGPFNANVNAFGFSKPMSKAIACFAGGFRDCGRFIETGQTSSWRFPSGYADNPAPMDTYGNAQTGNLKYHCGGGETATLAPEGYYGWHMSGYGWTAIYDKSNTYAGRPAGSNDELSYHFNWGRGNKCNMMASMPTAVRTALMDYMNLFQIRVK